MSENSTDRQDRESAALEARVAELELLLREERAKREAAEKVLHTDVWTTLQDRHGQTVQEPAPSGTAAAQRLAEDRLRTVASVGSIHTSVVVDADVVHAAVGLHKVVTRHVDIVVVDVDG